MRPERIFFFVVVAFAITNADNVQPTDLVDEAKAQLEELKSIVQGEIQSGHNKLHSKESTFGRHVAMSANGGAMSINQVRDTISAEIRSIKDLAMAAGKDVTTCTDNPEQTINELKQYRTNEMTVCLREIHDQVLELLKHSKYVVDVTFTTVSHLEFQIAQCRGDLLCISSILKEIELNKIKMPQNIKLEVQAYERNVDLLVLSVNSCADNNVAPFTTEAYAILNEIQVCVNKILG